MEPLMVISPVLVVPIRVSVAAFLTRVPASVSVPVPVPCSITPDEFEATVIVLLMLLEAASPLMRRVPPSSRRFVAIPTELVFVSLRMPPSAAPMVPVKLVVLSPSVSVPAPVVTTTPLPISVLVTAPEPTMLKSRRAPLVIVTAPVPSALVAFTTSVPSYMNVPLV